MVCILPPPPWEAPRGIDDWKGREVEVLSTFLTDSKPAIMVKKGQRGLVQEVVCLEGPGRSNSTRTRGSSSLWGLSVTGKAEMLVKFDTYLEPQLVSKKNRDKLRICTSEAARPR